MPAGKPAGKPTWPEPGLKSCCWVVAAERPNETTVEGVTPAGKPAGNPAGLKFCCWVVAAVRPKETTFEGGNPVAGPHRHPPRGGNQASFLPRDPLSKLLKVRVLVVGNPFVILAHGSISMHANNILPSAFPPLPSHRLGPTSSISAFLVRSSASLAFLAASARGKNVL
jgi:hypothetical protein